MRPRLAPRARAIARETRVGPIFVEVLEPLRALHVRVSDNEFGLSADLAFYARTAAIEEPRFTWRPEGRLVMDCTRLTQFGFWEGYIRIDGEEIAILPDRTPGTRDRSWGVRPVGEPEGGAPGLPPQFFWLWAPVHFDERCTHCGVQRGRRRAGAGTRAEASRRQDGSTSARRSRWRRSTIRCAGSRGPAVRAPREITLTPHGADAGRGRARADPHASRCAGSATSIRNGATGMWKGPEVVDGVTWTLADLDPMDPRHLHVQQLCRARIGDEEGLGVLEQLVIGPHAPSGFTSILDPAS